MRVCYNHSIIMELDVARVLLAEFAEKTRIQANGVGSGETTRPDSHKLRLAQESQVKFVPQSQCTSRPLISIDRELVVAYATLEAFVSHWPSRCRQRDHELLAQTKIIFVREQDRFYKQRRIALAQLSANM